MSEAVAGNNSELEAASRIEVDRSAEWVVTIYWASSLFWLFFATFAGLISSIKLHSPDFLGSYEWLTFGRIRPVHWDTAIYGFGGTAASGTLLWLQARLCQTRIPFPNLLIAGGVIYNLGVLLGAIGVLMGKSTGSMRVAPLSRRFFRTRDVPSREPSSTTMSSVTLGSARRRSRIASSVLSSL